MDLSSLWESVHTRLDRSQFAFERSHSLIAFDLSRYYTIVESQNCEWGMNTSSIVVLVRALTSPTSEIVVDNPLNLFAVWLVRIVILFFVSLWRRANARNVRLYYPYWQYTDLFIFRFVYLLCLRSTLRLILFSLAYAFGVFDKVDMQHCLIAHARCRHKSESLLNFRSERVVQLVIDTISGQDEVDRPFSWYLRRNLSFGSSTASSCGFFDLGCVYTISYSFP